MKIKDLKLKWDLRRLHPDLEAEAIREMESAVEELVTIRAEQLGVSPSQLRPARKFAEDAVQFTIPRAVMLRYLMRSGKGSAETYARLRSALLQGLDAARPADPELVQLHHAIDRKVEAMLPPDLPPAA